MRCFGISKFGFLFERKRKGEKERKGRKKRFDDEGAVFSFSPTSTDASVFSP